MTNVLDALEAAPAPSRRRFAAWVAQEPVLAGIERAGLREVLLDETEPVDYERRDDILCALIRLSRTDEQAFELLVVCLLPGLRAQLREHGWGLEHEEAAEMALAALCNRIWTYPLLRRPRKVAINLLLDTGNDLCAARDKELKFRANTYLGDRDIDFGAVPPDDITPDLVWDDARRAGVLNGREIALLRSTRDHDLDIRDIAPLLEMNYETARKARQRAVHKLRAWLRPDEQVA